VYDWNVMDMWATSMLLLDVTS